KRGAVPVNFVTSSYAYYSNPYANLASTAGGSVISLYYTDVEKAIKKTEWSENYLFKYTASSIRINESFPVKLGGSILLSGTLDKGDNLELFYGNNKLTAKSVNYFLPAEANCDDATYKKMQLLKAYDSIMQGYFNYNYNYNWQNMLIFGLTEKVVTPQTSYLVLERIEDYIKYKIAPPKELEEQCAELNYVYKPEYKIIALKEFTEQDALAEVVKDFNKRINWWSHNEPLVDLKRPAPDLKNTADAVKPADGQQKGYAVQTNTVMQTNFSTGTAGNLQEVVVTSAFGIKRTARSTASSVQNLSGEQVNTIRQININNALAGKVAGAQVRSQSIAKLGAETRIRLRGENGFGVGAGAIYVVDGNIMAEGADINPDDVEDYSVLQGPAAAALFGPDGSNGAIVMTTKKARRGYPRQYLVWSEYKLSSCEDEYYLQEMKNAADYELLEIYQKLENQNEMDVGFYFEMANFFFEKGKTDKAQELMYNAIELCRGTTEGLKLAAYLYEKWKWFDKAIAVYKGILSSNENNLLVKRDLALAYFQHKEFDAAVKTYYSIITAADENGHYGYIKENALMEMNTILLLHKNEFDVSYINPNLIKVLPVDLRISVESNYPSSANTQIIEPGNVICNDKNLLTVNGGRFTGKDNDNISYGLSEYSIKNAVKGRYRIKVDARNYYSFASTVPMYVRVIAFKNFQQANMEMEIKIFDLDNQYGVVELDDVKW
ncbi:MAG: TonB-dependent receptor plug domain-containing protein, partial [Ferruginibacter sp.]